MRRRPSARVLGSVAGLGGLIDAALLIRSGAAVGRALVAGLFMGAFVWFGLWSVTAIRFRIRPEDVAAGDVDATDRPRAGGWANPTSGQRFLRRLARLFDRPGAGPVGRRGRSRSRSRR